MATQSSFAMRLIRWPTFLYIVDFDVFSCAENTVCLYRNCRAIRLLKDFMYCFKIFWFQMLLQLICCDPSIIQSTRICKLSREFPQSVSHCLHRNLCNRGVNKYLSTVFSTLQPNTLRKLIFVEWRRCVRKYSSIKVFSFVGVKSSFSTLK